MRGRSQPSNSAERIVVLGTSAPNRFRTTASVLTFFYKNNIIRKFEVEQCSIHQNSEIMIRFGTKFSAQLFSLKLHVSEAASRYFQVIKLCCNELEISQYIVLNLCVQRRSRDGNKFGNIIRRWRGEAIIDCNADRRQFYIYLFNGGTDIINNDCYIRLSIDDRILERICLLNNDYSAGIRFEVGEPPKCEIYKEPTIISIDQNKNKNNEKDNKNKAPQNNDDESEHKLNKGPVCPKILLTGSCTNKSCTFRHNMNSSDVGNSKLGNDEQFWLNENKQNPLKNEQSDDDDCCFSEEEELKQPQINKMRRNHNNKRRSYYNGSVSGWKPAAYYSFKQCIDKTYNLDKTSDELEQDNHQYVPWTFEIDNNNNSDADTLNSLHKFLGQCWLFCVEFVREKEVPERFVNAIRQMRGINHANIESLSTDFEARYPIPNIFTVNMLNGKGNAKEICYYHPPFEYINSSRSSELRLKRHLHDLNYHGAHDVAFALESCLHNFPPVFIPEDLVDNHHISSKQIRTIHTHTPNERDPDIFFKCLFSEIKSSNGHKNSEEKDTFSNLMIENSYGNINEVNSKNIDNMALVWQALLYCSKNEEYRTDRSVVVDDVDVKNVDRDNEIQKQNVLPALELFYKSLDWAGSNGRKLKQKKNGNTHADHVWIKRVSIHPLRLTLSICEEESTRMFRFKQYSPPIDFCRIEFMDHFGNRSMQKEHFKIGNVGRYRAYKILQFGLNIAGITYQFLFFGNKQVRDAKVWMKAELIKGYDANRVRADIARLSQERNIGKKMDRFHLFMSKGTPGSIYSDLEIEIISDMYAKDEKILTDGCSLILEDEIKRSFPKFVASMLVRIGGAKTQMMSASKQLLEKLVLEDIERQNSSGEGNANINKNERNLSPKIILTESCLKFMTDTQKQLEIKKCCRALPCMLNREYINHCIFHRICALQPATLDFVNKPDQKNNNCKSFKLLPINKQSIISVLMKYQRKFTTQLQKMDDICGRQMEKLKDMKQRYGARSIYTRPASQEEQRNFFDTLLFLSSRLKVEESFLNRLTEQAKNMNKSGGMYNDYSAGKRLNFKDISDLTAILKRLWGGLKSKFKIQLDWPSCRMAGIADFQYKLSEFEIFLKIKIPHYFDWNCLKCGKNGIKYWYEKCDNARCNAKHPIYYVHRGPIGLLKNPCLHPGSYRLFNAVYYKELDEMFDGEVLVFSASSKYCSTSQVHKLSGGDLDGDDFLCVVQSDLLPLNGNIINCMEYDADKPLKMSGYVDISMCVKYWLDYQINDCVGIIAELHESFSDLELSVGSKQCLELAKAHSKAVDYAKTGIAAKIPTDVGIPFPVSLVKYPHHMGKHQSISFKSNSVKGILYDNVRIPTKLWRDKEFRKQYNLKNNPAHSFSHNRYEHNDFVYKPENPMQPKLTNRERLRERLNRGCQICGIPSFHNAHAMNQHKDDPIHKRNKQMARDKAMLQRIKDAQSHQQHQQNGIGYPPTHQHQQQQPAQHQFHDFHRDRPTRRNAYGGGQTGQTSIPAHRKYRLTEQNPPHPHQQQHPHIHPHPHSRSHSNHQSILPNIQPIPSLRNNENFNNLNNNNNNLNMNNNNNRNNQNQNAYNKHIRGGRFGNVIPNKRPQSFTNNNNNNNAMNQNHNQNQNQNQRMANQQINNNNVNNIYIEEKSQNLSPNVINIINVNQMHLNNPNNPNNKNNQKRDKKRNAVKRYGQWSVGDSVLYKNRDKCLIKDILYDSYPPRALILKVFQNVTMITEFNKLVQVHHSNNVNHSQPINNNTNNNPNNHNNNNDKKNNKPEARLIAVSLSNGAGKIINDPQSHKNHNHHEAANHNNSNKSDEQIPNAKIDSHYPYNNRELQIKESKDAAINLGFDEKRVDKEMELFLDVVKVSGHSLNPSCFLNYLCEVTHNEQY